ncbi:MAG TPA: hypothetical protein VKM35_01450 [Arenimonas sp.]|uniref:hypothetical protein n=1 Tax=Arenimonas sp. TaxID=1872635 RepID=UPI002C9ACE23|nr:hypothetical protein [Arenimonas sp.]HMB55852.1 hypothetical protein [Arenimonas sp.]
MKSRDVFRASLLLALIVGSSACSTTLFESLPTGKTTTCDAAWPGRWQVTSPGSKTPEEKNWVEINADCTDLTFIDPEKTQHEKHAITLVTTRAGQFLRFANVGEKADCIGPQSDHCGMELMRYSRSGDEIRIYPPDHRKVHEMLAGKSLPGYTDVENDKPMSSTSTAAATSVKEDAPAKDADASADKPAEAAKEPTFHNQIAGNAKQIAAILKQHPELFETTPWLILTRDKAPAAGKK